MPANPHPSLQAPGESPSLLCPEVKEEGSVYVLVHVGVTCEEGLCVRV